MRRILMTTTAVFASIAAVPAYAQDASANDEAGVADIVVTAQKREEKLQDISVAASVVSADSLAQQNATDLTDINNIVPSVELKGTFNGRVPYGLRGISTNANEGAIGLTSGVSIQVDGVPVPADSFAANTISDIAQLEVLKGPQATLGGRTASAGVINFVTFSPTDDFRGRINGVITDDGEYRMDAVISGPISDTISYSLSGVDSHTPYPIRNLNLGVRSHANFQGVRGKLKFSPSEQFDITLMGHYALTKSRGGTFTGVYFTPGAALFPFIPSEFNGPFGSPSFFGIRPSVAFPGYTIGYGNRFYSTPVDMRSRYEDKDGSVSLAYKTDSGLVFSSTTAYFEEDQFQSQDIFLSDVFFFDVLTHGNAPHFGNVQSAEGKVKQTTQEFKIASDPGNPVNFLLGAYYSDMKVDQTGLRVWVANPISKRNISTTKNTAIYGRVTAKLAEQISVVGGLRWNHDKIGWELHQFFNPPAGQFQGCFFNGQATPPTGAFPCDHSYKDSSSKLVGDAAVQFRPSEDMMVYGSYTRGYKPRAFNTVHDFNSLQSSLSAADLPFTVPTKAEKIDSFEVGLKSSMLDRHLTFNAAAFYTKYNGYQAQIFDTRFLVGVLVLANAGAKTSGLEADLAYNKGNTSLSLSAAYINAKFTNFANAVCYPTQTAAQGCVGGLQDLSGARMPASPRFKANLSGMQTVPLSGMNILLGGNVSYRSSTLMQADQNPQTRQPSFALVDLSLGFQTKDEKATLTFFVNNLTNKFYYTNMEDFFSGAMGAIDPATGAFTPANYVIGQPARDARRFFGGRVNFKF